ncbi:MAG TPA: ABC transporter permease, partial [Gemmatimonadaceae bacterium]|nr:ABC transporter permease [Gemmatimonadaceae bacterium]
MTFDSIRIAARTLRKQPVFASVVVVSLALAIALNTTMYGVLDALIHPRIDAHAPGQLYTITFYGDYKFHVSNVERDSLVREGMRTYQAITRLEGAFGRGKTVQAGAQIANAVVAGVASNYFDVLGAHAVQGRTFVHADETSGVQPVVISQPIADVLFPHGDSPIGRVVEIDGAPHAVIGVVSRYASLPGYGTGVWIPTQPQRDVMYTRVIRIRDGVTRAEAERELQTVADRIVAAGGPGSGPAAFRLHSVVDPDFQFRGFHLAIVLAVVAVLLVACSNLANIQLARGITRRRELALRSA